MKVLITGASGFVGSHLSDLFTKHGHEVYGLIRDPLKAKKFEVQGKLIKGQLSSTADNSWIKELPSDLDTVIHTAGIVHSFKSSDFFEVNTEATKKLINDLSKKYEQLNFIFISSLSAAGPCDKNQDEKKDALPVSDYGRSKLFAEKFLLEEAPSTWSKSIIRPPMIIGPRDVAVLDIFKMVKTGFIPSLGSNGSEKVYSFVGIYDLIETIRLAAEKRFTTPEIFYSSYPHPVKFDHLIEAIAAQMEVKKPKLISLPTSLIKVLIKGLAYFNFSNVRLTPDKVEEIIPMAWTCSGEKASVALGQKYEWDIQKTIQVTLEDYKKRQWI